MSLGTIWLFDYSLIGSVQVDPKKFAAALAAVKEAALENPDDPNEKGIQFSFNLESSSLKKFEMEAASAEGDFYPHLQGYSSIDFCPEDEDEYFNPKDDARYSSRWLDLAEFFSPITKALLPGQSALFRTCLVRFDDDVTVMNSIVGFRNGELELFEPAEIVGKIADRTDSARLADWIFRNVEPSADL